jgi:hypothetical protein
MVSSQASTSRKEADDILGLPKFSDQGTVAVHRLLLHISAASVSANSKADVVYASLMLVEDTIVQGLSKYSGNGLAVYGMVQVKLFENYEQAFELGQLSLSISQELQVADSVVGTAILSVGVLHIKQPIRDLVDPLSRAFDRSFSDGQVFF